MNKKDRQKTSHVGARCYEEDREKLQKIVGRVVESYYNGISGVVINFEEKGNMSFDDVLKQMGCE